MSERDVRIPADAADKQTTDAKSALPPAEFTLTKTAVSNVLAIQDRQGVQDRVPTVSYRIYFLPQAFAPPSNGTTTTTPSPAVMKSLVRDSGRQVANLVADIKAPALGTVLNYTDNVNAGMEGYYYCVGVNRAGVEAPPEHFVATNGLNDVTGAAAAAAGGGGIPIITAITSINSDTTPAQILDSPDFSIIVTDIPGGRHDLGVRAIFQVQSTGSTPIMIPDAVETTLLTDIVNAGNPGLYEVICSIQNDGVLPAACRVKARIYDGAAVIGEDIRFVQDGPTVQGYSASVFSYLVFFGGGETITATVLADTGGGTFNVFATMNLYRLGA